MFAVSYRTSTGPREQHSAGVSSRRRPYGRLRTPCSLEAAYGGITRLMWRRLGKQNITYKRKKKRISRRLCRLEIYAYAHLRCSNRATVVDHTLLDYFHSYMIYARVRANTHSKNASSRPMDATTFLHRRAYNPCRYSLTHSQRTHTGSALLVESPVRGLEITDWSGY
jgi:hypothetical protein